VRPGEDRRAGKTLAFSPSCFCPRCYAPLSRLVLLGPSVDFLCSRRSARSCHYGGFYSFRAGSYKFFRSPRSRFTNFPYASPEEDWPSCLPLRPGLLELFRCLVAAAVQPLPSHYPPHPPSLERFPLPLKKAVPLDPEYLNHARLPPYSHLLVTESIWDSPSPTAIRVFPFLTVPVVADGFVRLDVQPNLSLQAHGFPPSPRSTSPSFPSFVILRFFLSSRCPLSYMISIFYFPKLLLCLSSL